MEDLMAMQAYRIETSFMALMEKISSNMRTLFQEKCLQYIHIYLPRPNKVEHILKGLSLTVKVAAITPLVNHILQAIVNILNQRSTVRGNLN